MATTTGILAGGHFQSGFLGLVGPSIARLFSAETPIIARWFAQVLLLISAQLALVVWWVRRHSEQDFAGRYRIWIWVTAALLAGCFSLGTNFHLAASQSFLLFWRPSPLWRAESVCWLAPASGIGLFIFWKMHGDMRGCRTSATLLWFSTVCLLSAVILELEFISAVSAMSAPLVLLSLQLFGTLLLFHSLLLHVRHVLYENSEAPEPPTGWFHTRGERAAQSKPRQHALGPDTEYDNDCQEGSTRAEPEAEASAPQTRPARRPAPKKGQRKPARSTSGPPQNAETPVASPEPDDAQVPSPHSTESAAEAVQEPTETAEKPQKRRTERRVDNNEALKGLSKKERRKLRKQWRDEERLSQEH